jgi:hypothetical protein
MKTLQAALLPILTRPTPEGLVTLQRTLLASGPEGEEGVRALEVAGHFHAYLCDLHSKLGARAYSELASRLDIGAVGAVALESVVATEKGKLFQSLLLGGLGEALMVVASRQYIKAWEIEAGLAHSRAAWFLTEALWRTSSELQPDMPHDQRWHAIQSLLAPVDDPEIPGPYKAVLLGRVFQVLLLTHLAHVQPLSGETLG